MKGTDVWNSENTTYGYKAFVSADGIRALQPHFLNEIVNNISVASLSGTYPFSLYANSFKDFASSSDLQTNLSVMDSFNAAYTAEQKTNGIENLTQFGENMDIFVCW